jgi:hypothetical protein
MEENEEHLDYEKDSMLLCGSPSIFPTQEELFVFGSRGGCFQDSMVITRETLSLSHYSTSNDFLSNGKGKKVLVL